MSVLLFTVLVLLGSLLAGFLGSLTGLGGGVIVIPLLSLGLGVHIHYAVGAALISVIATSSGSAAAYVKEGITNMRIGMFLEVATTIGAVLGAIIATRGWISSNTIAILFGLILIFSAIMALLKKEKNINIQDASVLVKKLKLNGTYPNNHGEVIAYSVKNVVGGFGMMSFAGIISGLLGIGSGALKVIAMDNIMRIPFKVSTTTSNFMIGVTAAASAVIYLQEGYVRADIAMPVVIGVVLGAMMGAKYLLKSSTTKIKYIFAVVILFMAVQMIYKGINGGF